MASLCSKASNMAKVKPLLKPLVDLLNRLRTFNRAEHDELASFDTMESLEKHLKLFNGHLHKLTNYFSVGTAPEELKLDVVEIKDLIYETSSLLPNSQLLLSDIKRNISIMLSYFK